VLRDIFPMPISILFTNVLIQISVGCFIAEHIFLVNKCLTLYKVAKLWSEKNNEIITTVLRAGLEGRRAQDNFYWRAPMT